MKTNQRVIDSEQVINGKALATSSNINLAWVVPGLGISFNNIKSNDEI